MALGGTERTWRVAAKVTRGIQVASEGTARPAAQRLGSIAVFASVLSLVTATAHADDYEEFRAAQEQFLAQDYQAAASGLEELVGGQVPRVDGPLRLEARKYLGASYVFLGRNDEAEAQFEALVTEDPQHVLDPVAFSSEVLGLFMSVRERTIAARDAEAREEQARQARLDAEEAARQERLLALLEQERAAEPSRWIAAIPFGPGQFQNGDETLGWFFVTAGAVTGITSIVTAIIYHSLTNQLSDAIDQGEVNQAADIRDARDITALTNRLSFATFAAIGIASIVDAQVRFREREKPDETTLQVGLGSFELTHRF